MLPRLGAVPGVQSVALPAAALWIVSVINGEVTSGFSSSSGSDRYADGEHGGDGGGVLLGGCDSSVDNDE